MTGDEILEEINAKTFNGLPEGALTESARQLLAASPVPFESIGAVASFLRSVEPGIDTSKLYGDPEPAVEPPEAPLPEELPDTSDSPPTSIWDNKGLFPSPFRRPDIEQSVLLEIKEDQKNIREMLEKISSHLGL